MATDEPDRLSAEILHSLDAHDPRLLPVLRYLLQDIWTLGSDPDVIADLVETHVPMPATIRVLDLACGKGAVGIALAHRLGCRVEGIDAFPAFVEEALGHAARLGVDARCGFTVGDLRAFLDDKRDYDLAIWGAAGYVLGSLERLLERVRPCVRAGGFLVLDDACVEDGRPARPPYLPRADVQRAFARTGWELVEERRGGGADADANRAMTAHIRHRAEELKAGHPEIASAVEGYVRDQEAACAVLEQDVTCVTWLLRRAR